MFGAIIKNGRARDRHLTFWRVVFYIGLFLFCFGYIPFANVLGVRTTQDADLRACMKGNQTNFSTVRVVIAPKKQRRIRGFSWCCALPPRQLFCARRKYTTVVGTSSSFYSHLYCIPFEVNALKMPFFPKKQSPTKKVSPKKQMSARKKVLGQKLEKILELELIATGFKFGKGGGPGGWYRPFVQITNANGQVVGRSQILSCACDAQWPVIRLAMKTFAPPTAGTSVPGSFPSLNSSSTLMNSSSTLHTSSTQSIQSETSSVDEATLCQPLLLVVYDYNEDGIHLVMGRIKTSLQALMDRANELKAKPQDTAKELRKKEASYTLKTTDKFQQLYVKQTVFLKGVPDEVSATCFAPQRQQDDPKRFPDLEQVPPPDGLRAGLGRRQVSAQISKLSISEADDTETTTLTSSYGDLDYGLDSNSDDEQDEEEERCDEPVIDKGSLRRERAQAMIAEAQARIQKRRDLKKKKSSRLMAMNLERASVRFNTADLEDNNNNTRQQEHQERLDKINAMRQQFSEPTFRGSTAQKDEPEQLDEEPSSASRARQVWFM